MPAVDKGTVNQAQVKLSCLVSANGSLTRLSQYRWAHSLLESSHEGDPLLRVPFLRVQYVDLCHGVGASFQVEMEAFESRVWRTTSKDQCPGSQY
jgi:hypothetical protein